jgi:hypothetical protein
MEMYLCIPTIPWYGYVVCHGVPKSTTVPIPALPVLETPQVYPYPCSTLGAGGEWGAGDRWFRLTGCKVATVGSTALGMLE